MTDQASNIGQSKTVLKETISLEKRSSTSGVQVMEVLLCFARRKWLIAKVTGGAIFLGVIVAVVLPVRYMATTRIMTPQQTPSTAALLTSQMMGSGMGSLAAAAGGAGGLLKNPNDTYIGLLKSRPIADAIIQQFGLMNVYRAKDMTAARIELDANTTVAAEKSGFISVSVEDKDKKRAAEIANAYTDALRGLTKALAFTEASQRQLFYNAQLNHAKEDLVAAEYSFQQIQQKKGLVQLDAQARMMISSLAILRAEVRAKEVEVQSLRSYSTERNPDVELAENQLSSLRSQVARLENKGDTSGPADLGLEDVPSAGQAYLSAEHDLQYKQIFYDLLLKQSDAARLDEAKEAAVIQVIETAIPPDRKSAPKRLAILLLFTFVGFFSGCLFAWVREWMGLEQSDSRRADSLQNLICAVTGRKATA